MLYIITIALPVYRLTTSLYMKGPHESRVILEHNYGVPWYGITTAQHMKGPHQGTASCTICPVYHNIPHDTLNERYLMPFVLQRSSLTDQQKCTSALFPLFAQYI